MVSSISMKPALILSLLLGLAPPCGAAKKSGLKKERRRVTLSELRPSQRGRLANAMLSFLNDKRVLEQEMKFHFKDPGLEDYGAYIKPMEAHLEAQGLSEFVPLPSWDPATAIPPEFRLARGRDNGKDRLPVRKKRPAKFSGARAFDPGRICGLEDLSEAALILGRWHDFVLEDLGGSADSEESSAAPIVWLWHAFLADALAKRAACAARSGSP